MQTVSVPSQKMEDGFTKYVLLVPLRSLSGQETVKAFKRTLTLFGTPRRLITDRGTNFTDAKTKQLLISLGIEHHLIAIGAPRANGPAERYVDTVLNMLTTESNNENT